MGSITIKVKGENMAAKKETKKETDKKTTKVPAKTQEQKADASSLNVRIDRLNNKNNSNVKAIASVTIGGFAIHGFKIMDSQKGLFIAMPSNSYTDGNGEIQYNEVFHPITKESREELISKIEAAYEQALENSQNKQQEEKEEEAQDLGEDQSQIGQKM